MEIKKKIEVEISPEEIEKMIKEKLNEKGFNVNDVKFNIKKKQWTEGHGIMEYDYEELIFEGVTAKVEEK